MNGQVKMVDVAKKPVMYNVNEGDFAFAAEP
jgi:hypothetical protein